LKWRYRSILLYFKNTLFRIKNLRLPHHPRNVPSPKRHLRTVLEPNEIPKRAQKLICDFGRTYLCEQLFSKMKYCKSKCRNRISDAHLHDTLRIAASNTESNITTRVVGLELKFQTPVPVYSSKHLNFMAPDTAPTSKSFRLRLQNYFVHWKLKTIVLFVQLACPTNYVCGTGTQISGSSSTI